MPVRRIDVVTAVHAPSAHSLADAYKSLCAQGRPGGPGVARTMALARVAGPYVTVLDADDQLTPGALVRDLALLEAEPALGWATSRVLGLLSGGSTAGFDADPEDGPLAKGVGFDFWKANGYCAQVHPAASPASPAFSTASGKAGPQLGPPAPTRLNAMPAWPLSSGTSGRT